MNAKQMAKAIFVILFDAFSSLVFAAWGFFSIWFGCLVASVDDVILFILTRTTPSGPSLDNLTDDVFLEETDDDLEVLKVFRNFTCLIIFLPMRMYRTINEIIAITKTRNKIAL